MVNFRGARRYYGPKIRHKYYLKTAWQARESQKKIVFKLKREIFFNNFEEETKVHRHQVSPSNCSLSHRLSHPSKREKNHRLSWPNHPRPSREKRGEKSANRERE